MEELEFLIAVLDQLRENNKVAERTSYVMLIALSLNALLLILLFFLNYYKG